MEEMKVQISEEVLRKTAQMLAHLRIRYQKKASEARNEDRKALWQLKSLKVAEVYEAICQALVEAEEQEG